MDHCNYYNKKQDQKTMSLPDAHWSEYMYTTEWANKMSFEIFKETILEMGKEKENGEKSNSNGTKGEI